MSCSYADGLSEYENKGVLGVPEKFESEEKVNEKCDILAEWIKKSKHVVVHTGAGISTSVGIPDFRGPNGVWTLEKQGKKPNINISFNEAIPSKTHMALKHLIDKDIIHYIISQNIDGLHLRTGIPRNNISELHGNMFIGQCNACECQFVRPEATSTVGKKCLNEDCKRSAMLRGRSCRGKLHDTILDWEDNLPEHDLQLSDYQSSLADLNICLGTTLQIVPSGNLPLRCKKYGGRVVIVNLQPTKHDKKADLIINTYVDDVLVKVMKKLGLEIPEYTTIIDPTKNQLPDSVIEWNILKKDLSQIKMKYDKLVREYKKRKSEENLSNATKKPKIKRCIKEEKIKKEPIVRLEKLDARKIRHRKFISLKNKNNLERKTDIKNLIDLKNNDFEGKIENKDFNNIENKEKKKDWNNSNNKEEKEKKGDNKNSTKLENKDLLIELENQNPSSIKNEGDLEMKIAEFTNLDNKEDGKTKKESTNLEDKDSVKELENIDATILEEKDNLETKIQTTNFTKLAANNDLERKIESNDVSEREIKNENLTVLENNKEDILM